MDIEFGVTHGEQLATLMRVVRDLHRDVYGNGAPGIKRKAESFMDRHDGIEEERRNQHRANTARLNIIIGLLIAIAAYIAIVVSLHGPIKTSADPQHIFHSKSPDPSLSSNQQPIEHSTAE